jgi:hypothetical protein
MTELQDTPGSVNETATCGEANTKRARADSPNVPAWKVGDWAVFDRNIVQIKEIRESGAVDVSDGSFETCGRLLERLRPLTLRNKRTIEWFDHYYRLLNSINGNGGFNFPDISRHFNNLILRAIDGPEDDKAPFDEASDFVRQARDYTPVIQGVNLFRRAA